MVTAGGCALAIHERNSLNCSASLCVPRRNGSRVAAIPAVRTLFKVAERHPEVSRELVWWRFFIDIRRLIRRQPNA